MNYLFLHHNFPGQYQHVVQHLARQVGNRVVFLTQPNANRIAGVETVTYEPPQPTGPGGHPHLAELGQGVLWGEAVAASCRLLKSRGFRPDIMIGHNGWGETLFVKSVWPDVPLLAYFEFFYRPEGADIGFDPYLPATEDDGPRLQLKNAVNLIGAEAADWGQTPTRWQHSLYPAHIQAKLSVIHEGVDTRAVCPDPAAWLKIDRLERPLRQGDEIVTYVARNLEPYRGFHRFMKAVPEILRRRPRAHVLIVGGDEVSYGPAAPPGTSFRRMMLDEVGRDLDPDRVHFLGKVPYQTFLNILQVSAVHVYLTYPFVLSWSFLEAMAAGCIVIGSDTPPVREVIRDGVNGLLVDFFDTSGLCRRIDEALDHPDRMAGLRAAARRTVIDDYDLQSVCLPAYLSLLDGIVARFPGPSDAGRGAWPILGLSRPAGGRRPSIPGRGPDAPVATVNGRPVSLGEANAQAAAFIEQRKFSQARSLLASLRQGNEASHRMLFVCQSALSRHAETLELFGTLPDHLRQDSSILHHAVIAAVRLGQPEAVRGTLEFVLSAEATADTADVLARVYPAWRLFGAATRDTLIAKLMGVLDRAAFGSFAELLGMAHDLMAMERWEDFLAVERALRREATDRWRLDRLELLYGQAGFHKSRFDLQLASLNNVLGRQSLGLLTLEEPDRPLSVGNLRPGGVGVPTHGPLVTVLITGDGRENGIAPAVRSILDQTYGNIELIVVGGAGTDGASMDGTGRIVPALGTSDPRLSRLALDAGVGPCGAMNAGLSVAKGEFVVGQDPDGWAHPEKIAVLVSALLSDPARAGVMAERVGCSPERGFDGRGGYLGPDTPSLMFRRRETLERIGYYDFVREGADAEFQCRMEREIGADAILRLPRLLSISAAPERPPDGALAGGDPVRHDYERAFKEWHDSGERLWIPFPMQARPFAAPEPMMP